MTPGEFLSERLDEHQAALVERLAAEPQNRAVQRVQWMLRAQREILGMLSGALEGQVESMAEEDFLGQSVSTAAYQALDLAIRSLARVYRDHKDYDPKWEMAST